MRLIATKIFAGLLLLIPASDLSGEEFHPFADLDKQQKYKDISHLTCGDYANIVKTKQRALLDITIWLHGYTSAAVGHPFPFNEAFVTNSAKMVLLGCKDPNQPLATAFVAGTKLSAGGR